MPADPKVDRSAGLFPRKSEEETCREDVFCSLSIANERKKELILHIFGPDHYRSGLGVKHCETIVMLPSEATMVTPLPPQTTTARVALRAPAAMILLGLEQAVA